MLMVTYFPKQERKGRISKDKPFPLKMPQERLGQGVSIKVKNYLHFLKAKLQASCILCMLELRYKVESFHDNVDDHNSFSFG